MSPYNSPSPHPSIPAPPQPSADTGIQPPRTAPPGESDALPDDPAALDIWTLPPAAAVRLLTGFVEALMVEPDGETSTATTPAAALDPSADSKRRTSGHVRADSKHHEDVPESHKTPIGSPELHPVDSHESHGDGDGDGVNGDRQHHKPPTPDHDKASPLSGSEQSLREHIEEQKQQEQARQQKRERQEMRAVLARKFAGKAAPPIELLEYLQRLHTYCPMSTAVYLAAGVYLERLVAGRVGCEAEDGEQSHKNGLHGQVRNGKTNGFHDSEPATFCLRIFRRNSHRLLLGALRIATKLLEDRSYPHSRFARVGGVTERELTRLELNFAFLAEFHLLVPEAEMQRAARHMRSTALAAGKES